MSAAPEFRPDHDRLAALAEFAAGAGHEINNPLAIIIGRAQQLLRDESDPQRRHSLSVIAGQAYRIRDMIGDVMAFARPPAAERRDVDLATLAREVAARLSPTLSGTDCSIEIDAPESLPATVDSVQMSIVISELLRNSQQALQPGGGSIQLRLGRKNAEGVILEVCDHGRGFSESERIHAFDPFFSGRQAGRGLGFGLCKVWQIVRQHGGDIAVESEPGGPTRVRVVLH